MAPTRSPPGPSGAAQDRMVGRTLGARYRVISRLGEGGMGTVYLCEHAVLGRRYAVKVLRPDLDADPELVERFRNEAIAASRIGGENVVDVLDFGEEDDGALYFVMEALDGRSLGVTIAEEGPLPVPRALAILEQLCRALGAAHARGVIHRDVKPDNVFVVHPEDGSERVKVIDFGISQVTTRGRAERLTRAGSIIGTPEYMAPEQAAGDPVDHRTDVYALGVLAYEMLTGTLPIVATTPVATLVAHQTREPDAPSRRRAGIPSEVDALVLAMLAKRPDARPASMDEIASRIAALRGGSVRSGPETGPRRPTPRTPAETVALPTTRPPARRARLRALAIALSVALLASAAAMWARSARRDPAPPAAPLLAAHEASAPPAPVRAEAAAPAVPAAAVPAAQPSAASSEKGARRAAAPARKARRSAREGQLDDPYGTGGLKPDPFE